MLTLSPLKPKFLPLMLGKGKKVFVLIAGILLLQSCYTLLHPPETLPQTVTTVVTEQAMASSLGGTGLYGWDPYWEPALPFTSYHRGYGSSYYSPYNYYDYQDPYYAPVYIVGETSDPAPARQFGRDDQLGGARNRQLNGAATASSSDNDQGGKRTAIGMSAAAPVSQAPVKNPIIKSPPTQKTSPISNREVVRPGRTVKPIQKEKIKPGRTVKPIKSKKIKPSQKNKDKSDSDQSSPKKRVRTRK